MGKKTKMRLQLQRQMRLGRGSKAISKPQQREGKQALQFERPIILAHRGGALLAPEHTMVAFEKRTARCRWL